MPQARQDRPCAGLQWDIAPKALERWAPGLMAAASADNTISVLDVIGSDPWSGGGVTSARVAAALRSIGADKDVVVNINSPGGDLFEGLAIYNMLRDHKGAVTVKVLGMAASAASIIAMAGDTVQVARAGFLMIHDTWVVAIGNRIDLRTIADTLEPFDAAMASIYAARTGAEQKAMQKMMDAETWIGGESAVAQGFADELLPADEVKEDPKASAQVIAARAIERGLAAMGLPRSKARDVMNEFKSGTRDAAGAGMRDATDDGKRDAAAASEALAAALRSFVIQPKE